MSTPAGPAYPGRPANMPRKQIRSVSGSESHDFLFT